MATQWEGREETDGTKQQPGGGLAGSPFYCPTPEQTHLHTHTHTHSEEEEEQEGEGEVRPLVEAAGADPATTVAPAEIAASDGCCDWWQLPG